MSAALALCLWVWAAAAPAMLLAWLIQQRTRNAGIVDAVWALGVGAACAVGAALAEGATAGRLLAAAMGLWGLRLGLHLWRERVWRRPEEGRYQRMRAAMGRWAGAGHFAFFQVQATWIALFAFPPLAAAHAPAPPLWAALLGAGLWLTGALIEAVADHQLARHRAAAPGSLCTSGLWAWSRHPNYFGQLLTWTAWPLLAIELHGGAWLWLAPVAVFVFLRWLTGVPWVEQRLAATRGAAWTSYAARTPCIIPWRIP